MMKKILVLATFLSAITACATVTEKPSDTPKIGMANPASENCIQQGGQLQIKDEANGQVGYCHLADGRVIEEWALFQLKSTECVAEEAKKLVGQIASSDESLQAKTHAKIVRRVAPDQAMTMDYRSDRLTVVVAPSSNRIISASCG